MGKIHPLELPTAQDALKWLAFARRPLFIEELVQTSVANSSRPRNSTYDRLRPKRLLSLLQDLVLVQPRPNLVGNQVLEARTYSVVLAHASVLDFLLLEEAAAPTLNWADLRNLCFTQSQAQTDIAFGCLYYLYVYNKFGASNEERPLLQYAWYNWEKHIISIKLPGSYDRNQLLRSLANTLLASMQVESSQSGTRLTVKISETEESSMRLTHYFPFNDIERLQNSLRVPFFFDGFNQFWPHQVEKDLSAIQSKALHLIRDESHYNPGSSHHFVYKPLPQRGKYIRIMELLPGLSDGSPIYCRLRDMDLTSVNQPKYDALSYVWEYKGVLETIFVNKIPHEIPKNLAAILRKLCAQEGTTPTLWVDALCINMNDFEERSRQISYMAEIYSSAQQVVIIINSEDERDKASVNIISRLALSVKENASRSSHRIEQPVQDSHLAEYDDIIHIFQHKWWLRIWVIQELVLAANAILLFGSTSLDFDTLRMFLSSETYQTAMERTATSWSAEDLSGWRAATSMAATRTRYREGIEIEISELLWSFRHQRSADPRDKIFALLGIAKDLVPPIVPDYSTPASETSVALISSLLHTHQNLDFLSICSGFTRPHGCPWIPDFSNPIDVEPLHLGIFVDHQEPPEFSASGNWVPDFQIIRDDDNKIPSATTSAIRCGQVKAMADVDRDFEKMLNWEFDFTTNMRISTSPSHPPIEILETALSSNIEGICKTLSAGRWPVMRSNTLNNYGDDKISMPRNHAQLRSFLQNRSPRDFSFLPGRKVALLDFGRLALVPQSTKLGDAIVVLPGGAVPYVVRFWHRKEHCIFVGEW